MFPHYVAKQPVGLLSTNHNKEINELVVFTVIALCYPVFVYCYYVYIDYGNHHVGGHASHHCA